VLMSLASEVAQQLLDITDVFARPSEAPEVDSATRAMQEAG